MFPACNQTKPRTGLSPIVVEVPHAGLCLDPPSIATMGAPARCLVRDADLYVDELVADAADQGASVLVANMSRYVVDLNRDAGDYDALSVEGGKGWASPRGVIWRVSAEDEVVMDKPLSQQEYGRRIAAFYAPYHQALDEMVQSMLERFGRVVTLSMHSMPSVGKGASNKLVARADVVIGTRSQTTAGARLIAAVEDHARSFGWSVAHDDPYRGGATTARLGRPDQSMHAIQIELSRRLYMDEVSLERRAEGFSMVRAYCSGLVAKLAAAALP